MTSIRITFAALALSAVALAQASEITEFPITTSASLTRAEVQAEARKHYATGSMSVNFAGAADVKAAVSAKTRDEVRKEITSARDSEGSRIAAGYLVGGM